jgi:HlyD family secretion protein
MSTDANGCLQSLHLPDTVRSRAARPPSSNRRYIIGGIAGVTLLALVFSTLRHRSSRISQVDVVRASAVSNNIDDTALSARGYIVAHHRINVNSKVTGRVAWIGVEKGEKVEENQILVRLEDDEFRAQVEQAEGTVASAKAYLEELESGPRPQELAQAEHSLDQARATMLDATITLNRTKQLAAQGVFSKQVLDDVTARFETSEQQVRYLEQALQLVKIGPRAEEIARAKGSLLQAEGQLAFAQSQLDATVIRAPISGTILERTAEKGELVTAQFASGAEDGPQGSVVAIANLNDDRVALDIPQSEFARLHLKQKGTVTLDAFPDHRYEGVIAEISPEANSQKGTVQVKVHILNPDSRLRPQMNATVKFQAKENKEASSRQLEVLVPVASVHERGGKMFVFAASNGRVLVREVRIVAQRDDGLLVRGLEDGQNVITSVSQDLKEGDEIKIEEKP